MSGWSFFGVKYAMPQIENNPS
ncbi:hypothetical protein CCP4SC76_740005 [Gammaproteobacteria bacterium]